MNRQLSRRTLARMVASGSLAASIGATNHAPLIARAQTNGVASGGIGLTRTEFESYFGPGEATQSYAKYTDPTYGGPIYVGYDFVRYPDGMLIFLELQWNMVSQAGGLSVEIAANEVATVLPADARFVRGFWMGATPGGPISLRSEEWTSASLATARGGKGSILVTYQQHTGQLNPGSGMNEIVTAASIAIEA
jgi:hypothetical protein